MSPRHSRGTQEQLKSNVMKIVPLLFLSALVVACNNSSNPIARFEDYEKYLSSSRLVSRDPIREEVKFWGDRLARNPNDEASLVKLAGLHAELFKTTGMVDHILISDSLYHTVLESYPEGNVEIYHSLTANAITQHKFQAAKSYAEKALDLKDKKAASLLILVDVSLETGDYAKANQTLRQFRNKNSFAYLIRKAKVKDHEGMLDSAIACMEKAYQRVKGNSALARWALSNLGDMYGHAGQIKKAYDTYLDILENNPDDDYALKGIAWISLSHDKNFREAKRIINALAIRKDMPDAYPMLAEIAGMEGNDKQRIAHLKKFRSLVSKPDYKGMYNKYLALLEAEEFNPDVAVSIAQEEIANRPTPQSYSLLAWAYYNQRKFKKALTLAIRHVEDQTFEPDALYHLGMICLANGDTQKARRLLRKALQSEFELGPSVSSKIRTTLQSL